MNQNQKFAISKRVKTKIYLIFLVFPFSTATAQIFKCTADGKITVQDKPCAPSSAAISSVLPRLTTIPKASSHPPIGDAIYEREKEALRRKNLEEFTKHAGARVAEEKAKMQQRCGDKGEGQPFIGATSRWIRECSNWGEPSSINSSTTSSGTTEQWVYKYRGYLYFDHAHILRHMQSH